MSNKKSIVVGAALAGLSMGLLSSASAEEVHCWGVNSCGAKSSAKDKASCGVNEKQVAAAKKDFGDKYKNAETHGCGAHAKCGAKGGNLNWTKVKSKEECKKLGGFLMDKDGKITKL